MSFPRSRKKVATQGGKKWLGTCAVGVEGISSGATRRDVRVAGRGRYTTRAMNGTISDGRGAVRRKVGLGGHSFRPYEMDFLEGRRGSLAVIYIITLQTASPFF